MIQVCWAVNFLNIVNVIHFDIHARNIFVKIEENKSIKKPIVKLGDYSQSAHFRDGMKSHAVNKNTSTECTAPEQMLGQGITGWATDTWAVGSLIYYMATFEHPFGDPKNAADEYKQNAKTTEPDFSKFPSHFSEETKEICKWMLVKKRDDWPKMMMIIKDLDKHFKDLFSKNNDGFEYIENDIRHYDPKEVF